MQIDMHFYDTCAVARIAGLDPAQPKTIATAAQYVDEAVEADENIEFNDDGWDFEVMPGNVGATTTDAYHYNCGAAKHLNKTHDDILFGMNIITR